MSQTDRRKSSERGAGLAGAIAIESGTELGETSRSRHAATGSRSGGASSATRSRSAAASRSSCCCSPRSSARRSRQYLLGHGPNDQFFIGARRRRGAADRAVRARRRPVASAAQDRALFLGADSTLGRDEFLRLLYGAQVSFEVALLATIGSISIGVPARLDRRLLPRLGRHDRLARDRDHDGVPVAALHHRARLDRRRQPQQHHLRRHLRPRRLHARSLILSLFGWFYPARIIRAVVLSLREKEFVEAARMIGSSDWRIIRSHILPHLVAPIIVYSTLSVAGVHPGRGRPLVPRRRHQAADRELGQPAPAGARTTTPPSRG